jgi:hypothetical protein
MHIPQTQGGPITPPDTGFLFVASYYSQDYGGGIRPRLHTGYPTKSSLRPGYHSSARTTVESTVSNNSSIVARRLVVVVWDRYPLTAYMHVHYE